jgi:hypothetical protein
LPSTALASERPWADAQAIAVIVDADVIVVG